MSFKTANSLQNVTHIIFSESLFKIHEDVLQDHWIPIVFFPIYNQERSTRPTQGYESDSARTMRLYHECWRAVLGKWELKTKTPHMITLGNGTRHQVHSFLGGNLGDQQVHILYILHIISKYTYIA